MVKKLISKITRDSTLNSSGALAYKVFFSFFPFLLFISALLGFLNSDMREFYGPLEEILPRSAFEVVSGALNAASETKSAGVLSFSLALSVFSASSGFDTAIGAVAKAYGIKERGGFFRRLAVRLFMVAVFAGIILSSFFLLLFGDRIYGFLTGYFVGETPFGKFFFGAFRYFCAFLLLLLSAVIIIAAPLPKGGARKLKSLLPGAVFCAAGWIASGFLFNLYIDNFTRFSALYGSIAGVFIFLLWLNLICSVFLIGAEINAVLYGDSVKTSQNV